MTKILGLDLGTNSIGWAVVDKEANKILDAGVRIFTEGVVKETIGLGDKEISKNAERRVHRQARRLNYRKRLRKIKLLQTLIDLKMCPLSHEELNKWKNWDSRQKSAGKVFPESPQFVSWLRLNPYKLRARAINEHITREEFGRILYHFIQRRGFLSSRKGSEDGAIYKGKDNMEGIESTRNMLDNKTLGEKLYEIYPYEGKSFKRICIDGRDMRIRARYTLREMYIREFEQIWQKQVQQLQLEHIESIIKKQIYLESSSDSAKSKRIIENYINKYGSEHVRLEDKKITILRKVPLKEYLAGKVEYTEEGMSFKSNESVIFWQRPLRSQKGLLGKCIFESRKFYEKNTRKWIEIGAPPCPTSHPDFELFRAYQFINNIRFGKSGIKLNHEQRYIVLDLINKSDTNFDFEKVTKALKLTYETFNYDGKLKVPGNPTHKRINSYFSEDQWKNHYQDIWHCFYFYDDANLLKNKLITTYGLSEEKAEKASKIRLSDGYGSVSLKAIRNILPFLKLGFRYSTAAILGGVKNAFGTRWSHFEPFHNEIISKIVQLVEKEPHKEYELIEKIKYFLITPESNYGFAVNDKAFQKLYHHSQDIEKKEIRKRLSEIENLRNPIVQKGLNEMRRLVNMLLDQYAEKAEFGSNFTFDKIHVELGRDLRNNKKMRQESAFRISENEKANEDARIRLAEYGLKPSRENISKYLLFREIQNKNGRAVCPFTNRTITITDLLGRENLYQIEHIVPYSISLDDSFANKTICESNFNRDKGEMTPFEFYQRNSNPKLWNADSWEEIEQRAFSLLPYTKAKRFTARKRPDEEEFIQRQLNDMRYISKKAAGILTEICDDVRVLPGRLTSELRRLWGLNNIVQPLLPLDLQGYIVDENHAIPHHLVVDQFGNPKEIRPIQADKPKTTAGEILIPGVITEKNYFFADKNYRHLKFDIDAPGLPAGRYWAKLKVDTPTAFTRIFTEKPSTNAHSVVYRGRVEKGFFLNDSIGRKLKSKEADGIYWVKIQVKKTTFIEPEKDTQPVAGKGQVLLYGSVHDNVFSSYVYQCETDLDPGRYWALLDVDFEETTFNRAIINPSEQSQGEIILTGIIDGNALFIADCDPGYQVQTRLPASKYYSKINVLAFDGFYPILNQPPALQKDESLIEGNVWVNKQTGEIMFDPKKNRDDHRHHAIDAITIAFTELRYLQKLSYYYGQLKERERGIAARPSFSSPWVSFEMDVKCAIDKILVSYSRKTKVMNKISKTIMKSGRKHKSVGFAARGRLHREYYFGKHPCSIPGTGDPKQGGVLFEKDNQGNLVYYFHIRKSITNIKNNKHVGKIVDQGIRQLIENRLREEFGINTEKAYTIPENFFFDKEKQPALFLKNKKGDPVPVRKIRLKEVIGNAVQLKDNSNQWVNPYNNHHVVIYEDFNGEMQESVVSLWDVVERISQGESIYKLPAEGSRMIATLQENDMFLLNMVNEQIASLKSGSVTKNELSRHLYRVQKISSLYYTFRHHLASTVLKEDEEVRIVSMSAWVRINPIKVKIDEIGNILIN